MKALTNNTHQQSLVEIFVQELDQIYYPGYTEELIASEPEKFNWELKEFQGQFSLENKDLKTGRQSENRTCLLFLCSLRLKMKYPGNCL